MNTNSQLLQHEIHDYTQLSAAPCVTSPRGTIRTLQPYGTSSQLFIFSISLLLLYSYSTTRVHVPPFRSTGSTSFEWKLDKSSRELWGDCAWSARGAHRSRYSMGCLVRVLGALRRFPRCKVVKRALKVTTKQASRPSAK